MVFSAFTALLLAVTVSTAPAQAQTTSPDTSAETTVTAPASQDTADLSQYYTIDDNNQAAMFLNPEDGQAQPTPPAETQTSDAQAPDVQTPATNISPFSALSFQQMTAYVRAMAVNLLRWTYHDQGITHPHDKYNRTLHFGRWINDPNDQTCYNTRARVLIRDSATQVDFKDSNHCVVEKGTWNDPYSGATMHESTKIQIDHMVPLKNAYISGAWEWNFQTRCTYANFMGNTFHLISASGHENMSKGDSSPEEYLPPMQTYRCDYIENWLKIKLIWKLRMSRAEVEAIRKAIKENSCNPRRFAMSAIELKHQRRLIYERQSDCPNR